MTGHQDPARRRIHARIDRAGHEKVTKDDKEHDRHRHRTHKTNEPRSRATPHRDRYYRTQGPVLPYTVPCRYTIAITCTYTTCPVTYMSPRVCGLRCVWAAVAALRRVRLVILLGGEGPVPAPNEITRLHPLHAFPSESGPNRMRAGRDEQIRVGRTSPQSGQRAQSGR